MNLDSFAAISLTEIDRVALQNRVDTKFRFHISELQGICDAIQSQYNILDFDGRRTSKYETTYLDTDSDHMYLAHHNGKLNRYKIRTRRYVESDQNFLEVKFKSNKGRTDKKRRRREISGLEFAASELEFISKSLPYAAHQLTPKMTSDFDRFTLVNLQEGERITVDLGLKFSNEHGQKLLDNIVVLELKTSGNPKNSPLVQQLKQRSIFPARFSKYCLGRALLEPELKQNRFKERLMGIKKLEQGN